MAHEHAHGKFSTGKNAVFKGSFGFGGLTAPPAHLESPLLSQKDAGGLEVGVDDWGLLGV